MSQTDGDARGARPLPSPPPPYEPPHLEDLGSLAEMTAGAVPTSSDGFGPGSVLGP